MVGFTLLCLQRWTRGASLMCWREVLGEHRDSKQTQDSLARQNVIIYVVSSLRI